MDIDKLLESWRMDPEFRDNITAWKNIPARSSINTPFPDFLHPDLIQACLELGIKSLYSHQASALDLINQGKNVLISTGTASGKTLCYNLPIFNNYLKNLSATALFIFPTKALTQDQQSSLLSFSRALSTPQKPASAIFDGDTPQNQRSAIRSHVSFLLTNPDMLHLGILPHHTIWKRFFSGLRFVVVDEAHTYRGVFGSHFANLIRRLKRVAAFYGAYPQFILTSATIGNPLEISQKLVEAHFDLIDQDGSPHGEKNFIIYNPPLIDQQLGIRKSSLQTGIAFIKKLIDANQQSLVFARTRRTVEMILMYLLDQLPADQREVIRGYRSGYLKNERRNVESGLKSGQVKAVIATSALELGIDIGDLDVVILIGYPGAIATTRQRAGRAGRKLKPSLALLITTPDAMDQYLAMHPDYLFEKNPENALIDPNNFSILLQHIQCAAFELPFTKNDHFGQLDSNLLTAFLTILTNNNLINQQGTNYYWIADNYPTSAVSLRSTTTNKILLKEDSDGFEKVIGEVDAGSAAWLVHPEAIYLHEAEVYEVKNLDLDQGVCLLKKANPDYYTMPTINTTIENFSVINSEIFDRYTRTFGNISLKIDVSGYRKIRWLTNETIATGTVILPPHDLDTTGFWLGIQSELITELTQKELWTSTRNDYGPKWIYLREKIIKRDQNRCRACGQSFDSSKLHVHHIQPFKSFTDPNLANQPSNLVTLCPLCHQKAEINVRIRSGLAGASNALRNLAPLIVMSDQGDIGLMSEINSPLTDGLPAILVYDNIPGGLGLSEKLYQEHRHWINSAADLISTCSCQDGCPVCVGPVGELGYGGKIEALALLEGLR